MRLLVPNVTKCISKKQLP